ncbi:MAG TPA: Hpt domain-containing protein [Candidatus Thermoplasmatota archaeon]|nr:Hpt domain-containing protein [Candidatus Thermoplasmatota archaeon]
MADEAVLAAERLQDLRAVFPEPAALASFLASFTAAARDLVALLHAAAPAAALRAAHTLASSALMVGASELAALARESERRLRLAEAIPADLSDRLDACLARTCAAVMATHPEGNRC